MNYDYPEWQKQEIENMLRIALPGGTRLTPATKAEDFGGTDLIWHAKRVKVQVRCRMDRPIGAQWDDITFRHTEPRMIAARTYAPLALFLWFEKHRAVAGLLIDIYRIAKRLAPPLAERVLISNSDGTSFLCVDTGNLITKAKAVLRAGGPRGWGTLPIDGDKRLDDILEYGVDAPGD